MAIFAPLLIYKLKNVASKGKQRLSRIYDSPRGHWKGLAAVKKLAQAAMVSENDARQWLKKNVHWQIFFPAPRLIPRPKFDVPTSNAAHQADLLFMPHAKFWHKVFKYAPTVVDVASRFKEAEPLTSKNSDEVAQAFEKIYKRGPLKWPKLLQVDPGRESQERWKAVEQPFDVGML